MTNCKFCNFLNRVIILAVVFLVPVELTFRVSDKLNSFYPPDTYYPYLICIPFLVALLLRTKCRSCTVEQPDGVFMSMIAPNRKLYAAFRSFEQKIKKFCAIVREKKDRFFYILCISCMALFLAVFFCWFFINSQADIIPYVHILYYTNIVLSVIIAAAWSVIIFFRPLRQYFFTYFLFMGMLITSFSLDFICRASSIEAVQESLFLLLLPSIQVLSVSLVIAILIFTVARLLAKYRRRGEKVGLA